LEVAMMEDGTDKRRFRRLSPKEDAFALLKNHTSSVGQIINVSRGGLAFKYLADEIPADEGWELDVFLASQGFLWKGVPHRTILDIEMAPESPFSSVRMRRRAVAFQNLTDEHVSRLESLLDHCTRHNKHHPDPVCTQ
jgi:hypothetical protein